ncbi:MAG: toprim domain-containing protein [Puniceicoccaceae bacterium]
MKVLLPGAKLSGSHYRAGSVRGEPGTSLVIDASTGIWFDHATGQKGDPLALIMAAKEIPFPRAVSWALDCLEGKLYVEPVKPVPKWTTIRPLNRYNWYDLSKPDERALMQICRNLRIGLEGLRLAVSRGLLWSSGDLISITDLARVARADRNRDGTPVQLSNGSKTKSRSLGRANWPIGAANIGDRSTVILTEGFSDFLAGHHLLVSEGVQKHVSVCAMLGASMRIHPQALDYFGGKSVLIFCDADNPGMRGAKRWLDQLNEHCRNVTIYSFEGLRRDDGEPVNDLRDFLRVYVDDWEADPEVSMPVTSFLERTTL